MPFVLPKKIQTGFSLLGYYQIVGGIIGLILLISLLTATSDFDTLLIIILVFAFALFFFSVYCGILLLKRKESGLTLSIINQFLQILSFAFAGYSYQYISGVGLSIGIDFTESFNFIFYFGLSSWRVDINTESILTTFEVNIVAILVLTKLFSLQEMIKEDKNKKLIDNIISE